MANWLPSELATWLTFFKKPKGCTYLPSHYLIWNCIDPNLTFAISEIIYFFSLRRELLVKLQYKPQSPVRIFFVALKICHCTFPSILMVSKNVNNFFSATDNWTSNCEFRPSAKVVNVSDLEILFSAKLRNSTKTDLRQCTLTCCFTVQWC